jgi:hypothetical protein
LAPNHRQEFGKNLRTALAPVCQNRHVPRVEETLVQYGQASNSPALEWAWVDAQLTEAGTYWTSAGTRDQPHPRPVWGIWVHEMLHLSIGSPTLAASPTGSLATVHLDSGTDVVIVEGVVESKTMDPGLIAAYDAKYTWVYDVGAYGPLTSIRPQRVLAWRTAGWAGHDGFVATNRWRWAP